MAARIATRLRDIVTDDYDAYDDFWRGYHEALAVIRERVRDGGEGWTPMAYKFEDLSMPELEMRLRKVADAYFKIEDYLLLEELLRRARKGNHQKEQMP